MRGAQASAVKERESLERLLKTHLAEELALRDRCLKSAGTAAPPISEVRRVDVSLRPGFVPALFQSWKWLEGTQSAQRTAAAQTA